MNSVSSEPGSMQAPDDLEAEWAEEDRARADHYALIAQIFYAPPDSLLLAALATTGTSLGAGEGPLAEAWRGVAAAAGELDAEAVQDEYERLFAGIGKPEVMLYGSFYLAGFLNEEPLAELRTSLAELGLARHASMVTKSNSPAISSNCSINFP